MNKTVKLSEVSDVMLEVLSSGGEVSFVTAGVSMTPLLRNRCDKVVLIKPESPPRKNDVIFYRRDNGQFVLHRIISEKDGQYVLRGDNQWEKEYGITEKNILAVARGFVRKGKVISVNDTSYKLYCFFLPLIRIFRRAFFGFLRFVDKTHKRLKRKFNNKTKS